ncbi:MAG: hypothetical protein HC804_08645 [Anaerolineae bacterium]|nr:hypothetical protein [Anaerolineae bacterium]
MERKANSDLRPSSPRQMSLPNPRLGGFQKPVRSGLTDGRNRLQFTRYSQF